MVDAPAPVPYQAYKSKRNSRNLSNQFLVPNVQPPLSRPASSASDIPTVRTPPAAPGPNFADTSPIGSPRAVSALTARARSVTPDLVPSVQRSRPIPTEARRASWQPLSSLQSAALTPSPPLARSLSRAVAEPVPVLDAPTDASTQNTSDHNLPDLSTTSAIAPTEDELRLDPPAEKPLLIVELSPASPPQEVPSTSSVLSEHTEASTSTAPPTLPKPTPPPSPPKPAPSRKTSTFRRVPLATPTRSAHAPSPLRPAGAQSRTVSSSSNVSAIRTFESPQRPTAPASRGASTNTVSSLARQATSPLAKPSQLPTHTAVQPPPRTSSLLHSPSPSAGAMRMPSPSRSPSILPTPAPSKQSTPLPTPISSPVPSSVSVPTLASNAARAPAPYRPGFQPKGVYRPRTDDFIAARAGRTNGARIERARLERRLEKLVALHFPPPGAEAKAAAERPPPPRARRASSFFDVSFSELRSKGAGELWRGVLQSQALQSSGRDIRAAEQKITPWADDASASACPSCSAAFHPLTNRKHHCRLCGRLVCSLPAKRPQRPAPCSLLFVADPATGAIEEVSEGVDYGVRRRSVSMQGGGRPGGEKKGKPEPIVDEEKFLKGVRICRDCRPVILRQQYSEEIRRVPTFARLYEAFISLEHEIEADLPVFHELVLGLNTDDAPTKEASAARKRLLNAFAQYDALSKRIRTLPCPGGPGSSQDRMQAAVLMRANIFLQKNMFPLQSLPKPKRATNGTASPSTAASSDAGSELLAPGDTPLLDPDSELALVLQPLLEQEALLEHYVGEANAARKFEDARALKASLADIRGEIARVIGEGEVVPPAKKGRAKAHGVGARS